MQNEFWCARFLTTEALQDVVLSILSFLMITAGRMYNILVSAVYADGLAPVVAMTYIGTVMIKFASSIFTGPA